MARRKIDDAVEILHRKYFMNKTRMLKLLEVERARADIAQKIVKARTKAGLSQRDLARIMGTSASVICRLENADYHGHSIAMLERIGVALNQRVEINFVPLKHA